MSEPYSLIIDQFAQLLEEGESNFARFKALEVELIKVKAERDARAEEGESNFARFKALEGELIKVKAERDARAEEAESNFARFKALEGELIKVKAERDARAEEAELALLQLHQVQEELEHHFHQSCSKSLLLQKHQEQQKRIKKLLPEFLSKYLSQLR